MDLRSALLAEEIQERYQDIVFFSHRISANNKRA